MIKKIFNLIFGGNKSTKTPPNSPVSEVKTSSFNPLPKVEAVDMPSTAYFSPSDVCLNAIIFQLKAATKNVDICVFTISDDRISREIIACHKRNVKVRIISDNDKMNDEGSDIENLKTAGIPLKIDTSTGHMHHKFAIIDGKVLVNGSYNWTRSAEKYNYENIVVSRELPLIQQFQKEFAKMWENLSFYK